MTNISHMIEKETPLNLALGIVFDTENKKILIAKRKKGSHLEGKWEFPGGKIEPQESPEDCLLRELKEEFGIIADISDFVTESVFNYGDREIKLLGYLVKYVSGDFKLNAHDEIRWIFPHEFGSFDLAEADLPLAEKIITEQL